MAKKPRKEHNWYSVQELAGGKTEVYIYGTIGENFWDPEESNTAKKLIDEISGRGDLIVRINSRGGSLVDGIAIYNALQRHSGRVDVEIDAIAYSAASLIAMVGETITMAENALLMIHAPWLQAEGNAVRFRKIADVLDKYADAQKSSYARGGGMTEEEVEQLLKDGEDHYFTAQEAIDLGLIDQVGAAVDIAACLKDMPLDGFRNPIEANNISPPAAVAAAKPQPGVSKMSKEDPKAAKPAVATEPTEPQAPVNVVEIEKAAQANALAAIKARNDELEQIFSMHVHREGVQALKEGILKDPSITVDKARAMLLDKLGEGSGPINQYGRQIAAGVDSRDKRVEAMTQAMLSRVGAEAHDRQNPYRGLRLAEIARACLEQSGVSVRGMAPEEYADLALSNVRAAQTTSDFPVVLENTLHKLVLSGFKAVETTYQRVAKIGDVTDFRAWKRLVPGLIGNLDSVDEHGAYRDKPMPDADANSVSASRKGNIISITPEVLINDDIGYIQNQAVGFGMAGGRTIDRAFFTLLESNPTLSDGVALFHASHGNLAAAGAAPSVTTIDAGATAMAAQTAPGADAEILDIQPAIALAHRGLRGTLIEVVNAEFNDDTSKNQRKPNRVRGIVSDIVGSGRLTSTVAWYLFADPMIAPVIEVVFLNGQREPRVVMEESFRTSGLSWKIELPFGVGAIDYRGGWKDPGQ